MTIQGVRVRYRNRISPSAVANLSNTLTLVPATHRSLLRQIDVLPPANFGHGPEYAGDGSGVGWPRLSELCFDTRYRPHNFPLNRTLLHGLGFAGALTEIGLPANEVPLALATFNIGIEIGQLLCVAVILTLAAVVRRVPVPLPPAIRQLPSYAIGSLAVF